MSLELAIRATEILLAFAVCQQSLEHMLNSKDSKILSMARLMLAVLVGMGHQAHWALLALFITSIIQTLNHRGAYNGGSDRMTHQLVLCLILAKFGRDQMVEKLAISYLALQTVFSYFIPGLVKIANPQWRNGKAFLQILKTVRFRGRSLTVKIEKCRYCQLLMSWALLVFEIGFPLALVNKYLLIGFLLAAFAFHLCVFYFMGLNRFVWAWLAAYPSVIWFQAFLRDY